MNLLHFVHNWAHYHSATSNHPRAILKCVNTLEQRPPTATKFKFERVFVQVFLTQAVLDHNSSQQRHSTIYMEKALEESREEFIKQFDPKSATYHGGGDTRLVKVYPV